MINKIFNIVKKKLMTENNYAKYVGVSFGKNCKFRTKFFGSEPYLIEIGNDFETAVNVRFVTHDGGVGVLRNKYTKFKDIDLFKKIKIGNNVFVGVNAIILPGTVIGDNVIIGASSVVKGEVKSNSIYAGIPAKFISTLDDYILKNENDFMYTYHLGKVEKEQFLRKQFEVKICVE